MNQITEITDCIAALPEWQADFLRTFRKLIHEADPDITEEWKWSTPVYAHGGMICATGNFKNHVKINFFKGALIDDQSHFNAGLESKQSRSIDFKKGDPVDSAVIKHLVVAAVALNSV